tara:strand:+ start:2940 stop:3449 length:510 start_codon:yes stop_codon:yes gene_type:complete
MKIFKLAKKDNSYTIEELSIHLSNIRSFLLTNKIALEVCSEFGYDKKILLGIPISFSDDLDVSAKTTDGQMIINTGLIEEGYEIMLRYVVHELVHVFQHMENKEKIDLYPDHEYLDRPDELQAFQYQIEFDETARGEKSVIEYIEGLLDYHNVPDKDKVDKAVELMENI